YSLERGIVTAPTYLENFRNGGVEWISNGVDNLFPQQIIHLYNDASSMFTNLINVTSNFIAGAGWNKEVDSKTLAFLENQFGDEHLDGVAQSCALDLMLFGGFFLNVCWSANGKRIARIKHMPYEKVRFSKEGTV